MSRPALVFIGFMGAGKSTALAAAREAGLGTTEIDAVMEREFDSTIPEAFERHGEEGFRAREAEVVGALLDNADGGAIALGGGSILSERIRAALDRHIVVWLQVDARESWRRIAHSDRPLATSAEDVARLMAVREPLYEELADAVIPMGDRGVIARAMPTLLALLELPAGTRLLWATSESGEYPVLVGTGLLKAIAGTGWWPLGGRPYLIGDGFTMNHIEHHLVDDFPDTEVRIDGEESKTLKAVAAILEGMAEAGVTRADHVVALGGGVVGDMAGFVAHVYQRGVQLVQVPTTLVAQVDSAYGGKTGVDLPQGKNYVGAYQLPAAVIADTGTLASLPREELAAGFVEALKTGLLAGGALWERVRALDRLDPEALDDVVFACAHFKCKVVAEDERDGGRRHMLNLGHTVGHAIETATDYKVYRHGEAIGIGLLAALRLSEAPALREECELILQRHGLPTRLDAAIDVEAVLDALQRDKKRTAAGVGFVLLSAPGEPRVGQLVDPARVRSAVEELIG